jgi:seryl-tRNA(Sec) selenium transferase
MSFTRRDVLKTSGLVTAAALLPEAVTAAPKSAASGKTGLKAGQVLTGSQVPHTEGDFHENLFTRIGIRPLINCRGTITAISGSTSLPEVKQAMYNASLYHVRMDEMMLAVGAELGRLSGAEWGICVTGAAAATCLATIACIAGTNTEQCVALPYHKAKDHVVIPRHSRNPYDIGCRMPGVEIVEVNTPEELREKINGRTAMMYFLANPRYDGTPMGLKNLAAICKEKGVPVYVDGAATEPNNPNIFIEAGADLVAYSGGKCMRGPQSAGILIGKKDLCQAAYYQAAPHHCYGRALKCSKEETMGMLAAVRAWHSRDHEGEQKMWLGWMQRLADSMEGIPSVTAKVLPPPPPGSIDRSPGVRISWDAAVTGVTGTELAKLLDDGAPRIVLAGTGTRPDRMQSSVTIWGYIMTPAEIRIVSDAVRQALLHPPKFENPAVPTGAPADVSGSWAATIHYLRGTGEQHFTLRQSGNELNGDHHGELYNAALKGMVRGDEIAMTSVLPVTGYPITCNFKGMVSGNNMQGTLNMGEYGQVRWEAVRS